jgi:hypothetical protein
MQHNEQELARQVLAALLSRLDGGSLTQASPGSSVSLDKVDTPVIMLLLGQINGPASNTEHAASSASAESSARVETRMPPTPGNLNKAVESHPGLERFSTLEASSLTLAPHSCFMEPNRLCIHSGACEMRGF